MKTVYVASIENLRAFHRFNRRPRLPGYRKLQRQRQPGVLWIAMTAIFLSPALLLAGGTQLISNGYLAGLFSLAMGVLYVVMIVWFSLPGAKLHRLEQRWAKSPSMGKPITVEADEAGFHFLEPTIERHVEWSAVVEVDESPTHIFVVDRQPVAYIIPKEAFASPADAEAFGQFIRTHRAT